MSYGLVCQQCKEPIQLDASLVNLAPGAYDMIAATLPPSSILTTQQQATDPERTGSSHSKSTWQRTKSPSLSSTSHSPRAHSKQTLRGSPLPNESFIVLQDSVIRSIPPQPGSPRANHSASGSRGDFGTVSSAVATKATETEPESPSPLSHHLRSTARLFNLLSTRTDIDHPLCAECVQILLTNLRKQLEETKKERDGYTAFEKEVRKEREREAQGMTREEAEKKIEKWRIDEAQVIEQITEAEREREQLDEELRILEQDEKALEAEEAEFWKMHNDHLLAREHQVTQLSTLRAAYAADAATLDRLERTNVYNDAFCIGHDGAFGTINGLRLGRVPSVPVEWAEINAAWGQTLLLLHTIVRKLDYTFENYRLVPMGSFSRIEKTTGDKASYELYGSGDLHFGRLLHNRRFDIAMVAFLDCLKHLVDHIRSQDPSIKFPHPISKDKIGDVSVKLQFNQEEAWTKSLRHVLLALKICLKWATSGANG
ncbi:beclin 1 protein [Coprinopsis marcescibilis]|uniref:Beclin 1 protein n=1 Tax=Coprinopsis marcescibilis TaxID=230819 RepID=A0A5C3LDL2_COPMA|nr:beclin 1 protein [Coprinopsis marcescibilis]